MELTLAFDVYGTLTDTHGVVTKLQETVGARAKEFSQTWRDNQFGVLISSRNNAELRKFFCLYESCIQLHKYLLQSLTNKRVNDLWVSVN